MEMEKVNYRASALLWGILTYWLVHLLSSPLVIAFERGCRVGFPCRMMWPTIDLGQA